ncbi:MAG: antitoxin [Candidatus Omnitrophica bacterium]|nr:antitoxin [Candidatus Omnitrophota bacterium]
MRKIKLTKNEKEIENTLLQGEYIDLDKNEFITIAQAISSRKKDAVLNIRMNKEDLKLIKRKAQQLGIRYQTFISELLHRVAHN